MLHRPSTDQIAHDRVTAEPVGIIDVLIASQPREDCLPQQTPKRVTAILAGAVVVQQSGGKIGQAERVIQARCSSKPPSELIAEPRNSSCNELWNPSRKGPDFASPVAFAIYLPLRRA